MKIQKILNEVATKYSSKKAVIFNEREITFKDLKDSVYLFANVLNAQGVNKGDKVAIYLPNCLEYVYSYLACFCLGAVVVPLDYMLKSDELSSCLSHSEAKILVALPKNDVSFDDLKSNIGSLKKVLLANEIGSSDSSKFFEEVNIKDSDPALIMYTSGTTGKPKGILLNYKHLEGSPEAMHHFVDLSSRDVKLCPLPLSHIGGFIYIQNCINFGITLVLMDRFNPFSFLENIQKYKVTCFHIVPPMYNAIMTLKQIDI